mmetsp:Transcript_46063/g.128004  ORF Transcript_46063/g.128004 Transcript_46063/m.128004 type:complete len:259 (-) Transcript_46063:1167-1943(-)
MAGVQPRRRGRAALRRAARWEARVVGTDFRRWRGARTCRERRVAGHSCRTRRCHGLPVSRLWHERGWNRRLVTGAVWYFRRARRPLRLQLRPAIAQEAYAGVAGGKPGGRRRHELQPACRRSAKLEDAGVCEGRRAFDERGKPLGGHRRRFARGHMVRLPRPRHQRGRGRSLVAAAVQNVAEAPGSLRLPECEATPEGGVYEVVRPRHGERSRDRLRLPGAGQRSLGRCGVRSWWRGTKCTRRLLAGDSRRPCRRNHI